MNAFAVFAALAAIIYPRLPSSLPSGPPSLSDSVSQDCGSLNLTNDAITAFAEAFERPGSHPTTLPAKVPIRLHFRILRRSM